MVRKCDNKVYFFGHFSSMMVLDIQKYQYTLVFVHHSLQDIFFLFMHLNFFVIKDEMFSSTSLCLGSRWYIFIFWFWTLLWLYYRSLEKANARLVEELVAKELEYSSLHTEVEELNEKLNKVKEHHSREISECVYHNHSLIACSKLYLYICTNSRFSNHSDIIF